MGEAMDRLIYLTQVRAHTRKTPSGKVVQVRAYENSVDAAAQKVFASASLYTKVREAGLLAILKGGRFLNSADRGEKDYLDKAWVEKKLFGTDVPTVYAFPSMTGAANFDFRVGQPLIKLKDSVKKKATVTEGDSIGTAGTHPPTPLLAPQARAFTGPVDLHRKFYEVQIHGPVTVADIESVILDPRKGPPLPSGATDNEVLKKALDAAGIPWSLRQDPVSLALSHVRAHTRNRNGQVVHVKAYDTKTVASREMQKVFLRRNDIPPENDVFPNIDYKRGWLTSEQEDRESLRNYVDYGDDYNRLLRTDFYVDPDKTDDIKQFDKVIAHGKVNEPFTTYRSMVDASWLPKHVAPGTVLTDKGYSSTTPFGASASTWVPEHGVSFAIVVPKGAHAIYVPEVMDIDQYGEAEVLLPRGSQFEVISDDPEGIGVEAVEWPGHPASARAKRYRRLITVRLKP